MGSSSDSFTSCTWFTPRCWLFFPRLLRTLSVRDVESDSIPGRIFNIIAYPRRTGTLLRWVLDYSCSVWRGLQTCSYWSPTYSLLDDVLAACARVVIVWTRFIYSILFTRKVYKPCEERMWVTVSQKTPRSPPKGLVRSFIPLNDLMTWTHMRVLCCSQPTYSF